MYSFIFIHVLIHLVVYSFLSFFLSSFFRSATSTARTQIRCKLCRSGLLLKECGSWGCGVKNTVLLGRTKSRLGQTWPALAFSWAEHEPTWAQLGPNLRCNFTAVQHRATWVPICKMRKLPQIRSESTMRTIFLVVGRSQTIMLRHFRCKRIHSFTYLINLFIDEMIFGFPSTPEMQTTSQYLKT